MKIEKTPYGLEDNSYVSAGKIDGIRQLVDRFYYYMDEESQAKKIRDMHPVNLDSAKEKLTLFLCGWLGGPKLYQEKYGAISIPQFHKPFQIGEAERDAWLRCMEKAIGEQDYAEGFKAYLCEQFFIPAERIRAVCTGR